MAAFNTSHSQITKALIGVFPEIERPSIHLPLIEFPQVALPDTLSSLGNFANQLQSLIATALSHPFWAIGLVIVSIGLLQLVADLVKRILKAGLGLIITFPLRLSQWLWKQATTTAEKERDDQKRVTHLLNRLETLQIEQGQIMGELKELLPAAVAIHEVSSKAPKQPLPPAESAPLAPQSSAESP